MECYNWELMCEGLDGIERGGRVSRGCDSPKASSDQFLRYIEMKDSRQLPPRPDPRVLPDFRPFAGHPGPPPQTAL